MRHVILIKLFFIDFISHYRIDISLNDNKKYYMKNSDSGDGNFIETLSELFIINLTETLNNLKLNDYISITYTTNEVKKRTGYDIINMIASGIIITPNIFDIIKNFIPINYTYQKYVLYLIYHDDDHFGVGGGFSIKKNRVIAEESKENTEVIEEKSNNSSSPSSGYNNVSLANALVANSKSNLIVSQYSKDKCYFKKISFYDTEGNPLGRVLINGNSEITYMIDNQNVSSNVISNKIKNLLNDRLHGLDITYVTNTIKLNDITVDDIDIKTIKYAPDIFRTIIAFIDPSKYNFLLSILTKEEFDDNVPFFKRTVIITPIIDNTLLSLPANADPTDVVIHSLVKYSKADVDASQYIDQDCYINEVEFSHDYKIVGKIKITKTNSSYFDEDDSKINITAFQNELKNVFTSSVPSINIIYYTNKVKLKNNIKISDIILDNIIFNPNIFSIIKSSINITLFKFEQDDTISIGQTNDTKKEIFFYTNLTITKIVKVSESRQFDIGKCINSDDISGDTFENGMDIISIITPTENNTIKSECFEYNSWKHFIKDEFKKEVYIWEKTDAQAKREALGSPLKYAPVIKMPFTGGWIQTSEALLLRYNTFILKSIGHHLIGSSFGVSNIHGNELHQIYEVIPINRSKIKEAGNYKELFCIGCNTVVSNKGQAIISCIDCTFQPTKDDVNFESNKSKPLQPDTITTIAKGGKFFEIGRYNGNIFYTF